MAASGQTRPLGDTHAKRRRVRGTFRARAPRLYLWLARILFVVLLLLAWQYAVNVGLIGAFWVSTPTHVFSRLATDMQTSQFWVNVKVTLEEIGLGLLIGCTTGTAAGLFFGYLKPLYEVVEPTFMALYTLPRIALAPLFIIWFGIGQESKVALVVSLAFFIMLLNTYQGVRGVDPDLIDSVRTMGASRWFISRRVILPSAVPWILAGVRLSAVYGIGGAVVGEMLLAKDGLGVQLQVSANNFDTTGEFEILLVLGILGFGINALISSAEKRLLRWRPE